MTIDKRGIYLLILMFFALGCSKTKPGWKTIDMGEYLIDVPNDFTLKTERGIDSQPGTIKGKDFVLGYEYGPYCDTLLMTKQEYLRRGVWKDEAIMRFLNYKRRVTVDWVKTKVTAFRPCTQGDSTLASGCDLMASCTYLGDQFDLPVFFPQEIKDHVIRIDTVQNYYRRLIYPRKGRKGITGVYMRKAKNGNQSGVLHYGMVIDTRNVNSRQQVLAMEILNTLRPKPGE